MDNFPYDWQKACEQVGLPETRNVAASLRDAAYQDRNDIFVCPKKSDVFAAFHLTPFHTVRVVIVGQDPYHGVVDGCPEAHGLAFSTHARHTPPSLRNIFKELQSDLRIYRHNTHFPWLFSLTSHLFSSEQYFLQA